jgi:hypothetical protein
MTGIGGTPPLSPRTPPSSTQDDPPKPRALAVVKTLPKKIFTVSKTDAGRKKREAKEKEIIENLRHYENEEFKIVIQSTLEERKTEPEIETVEIVASPRGEFESKRSFFENLSKSNTTPTTTRSPVSSPRPLPHLPSGGLTSQTGATTSVISPRRDAVAVLPPVTPREPEKKT